MGWIGTKYISMELIVDKYLSNPRGSVKVTVLGPIHCYPIVPMYNSPVEIRVRISMKMANL